MTHTQTNLLAEKTLPPMSAVNELWSAQDDLARLSGLLHDAFGELLNCFISVQSVARMAGSLPEIDRVTSRAIAALQCEDMASQLIGFTQLRLSRARESLNTSSEISRTAITKTAWPIGVNAGVASAHALPMPPVQQDAMCAGTVEFF